MKKTIIAASLVATLVSSVYGQGTVFFNNGNTTKISTNSVAGGAATGLTAANTGVNGYYYALFYSTTVTTVGGSTSGAVGSSGNYAFNDAGWTYAGLGTNSGTAGRFASTTADAASVTQVGGVAGGTSANFVVIGWSANIGSTLNALTTWYNNGNPSTLGWIGEGVVGSAAPGILNSTPTASLFGTGAGLIQGFTLGQVSPVIIPEPTTLALAGLGGASLLLFRRRK